MVPKSINFAPLHSIRSNYQFFYSLLFVIDQFLCQQVSSLQLSGTLFKIGKGFLSQIFLFKQIQATP